MRSRDTSYDAQQEQIRILRQMPMEAKIKQVFSAYATGQALAMAGLRKRHPQASERRIWCLWAQQHLGPTLFEQAYGDLPDE